MTNEEIRKEIREKVPPEHRGGFLLWSTEEKLFQRELSCRMMINTCIMSAPGGAGIHQFWKKGAVYKDESIADQYIKILGRERVYKLVEEQTSEFITDLVADTISRTISAESAE